MKLKKLWWLTLVVILYCQAANGQQTTLPNFSGQQRRLLRQITRHRIMESAYIYEGGASSAQYARFDKLCRISRQTDLLALTHYTSPVVRGYAFNALLKQQNFQSAFNVLQTSKQDTAVLFQRLGCLGIATTVRMFMVQELRYAIDNEHSALTADQKQEVINLFTKILIQNDEQKIVDRQQNKH